jgi:hypothetical protein
MKLFDFIIPKYFFISFALSMIITYFITPAPEIIIKYPTPENAGKVIYKDDGDVCYKYRAEQVECPSDKSIIKSIQPQLTTDKK